MYSLFKDNIWGVDLADMQLISIYNKGIRYLLCVIDLFSRYAWVIPLKNKKEESIVEGLKKILNDSNRKPNKIWVDHGSEFYNNKFKSFLKKNDIEMYSTYNERQSVVAERFIKTLKNKIYKHMTTIGKNVYFNVLDDIVDKYINSFHSSIKIKPKDVNDDSFVEYNEETNKKSPKFRVGDHVRISKYKNIFAKGYTPNWSAELFVVNKVQNTVPWTYLINGLNGEEIKGSFYEKELQKTDQKEFRIEKVISVTINLSNYVTQQEFKNVTKVDTSDFALKTNVAKIKSKVDDIDIDKINGIDEKIMLKTVICILIKSINILKCQKVMHTNFCLVNQQKYLMKN